MSVVLATKSMVFHYGSAGRLMQRAFPIPESDTMSDLMQKGKSAIYLESWALVQTLHFLAAWPWVGHFASGPGDSSPLKLG